MSFSVSQYLLELGPYFNSVSHYSFSDRLISSLAADRARILEHPVASISLISQGWALTASIKAERSVVSKSVLVFSKIPVPYTTNFACISLSDVNRMRLIDMPENVVEVNLDWSLKRVKAFYKY